MTNVLNIEYYLTKLRDHKWSIAIHNDYYLSGKFYTFYLVAHPSGVWLKGEGESDVEALEKIFSMAKTRLLQDNSCESIEQKISYEFVKD